MASRSILQGASECDGRKWLQVASNDMCPDTGEKQVVEFVGAEPATLLAIVGGAPYRMKTYFVM